MTLAQTDLKKIKKNKSKTLHSIGQSKGEQKYILMSTSHLHLHRSCLSLGVSSVCTCVCDFSE